MLHPQDDYYTFFGLLNLPRWSQVARPFSNLPAVVNFEGQGPWDVMRANGFMYSMATSLIVPAATFAGFQVNLTPSNDVMLSPKVLLQPGCIYSVGFVPKGLLASYYGEIDLMRQRLSISSVESMA